VIAMTLLTIVDTHAFVRVALYGLLGAVGLVLAFGGALLAVDRAEGEGAHAVPAAARAGWLLLAALGGAACLALLGVGLWAMTQK
jgi:hypothetical protein